MSDDLRTFIREVPDFPQPGVLFRDVTPLMKDPTAFNTALDAMEAYLAGRVVNSIVGIESRGFLFGAPLAARLGLPFVPVRKPGKLPWQTVSASYDLEYGTDALEIHHDAVESGQRVLIVDDLLATGGTAQATVELIKRGGAEVAGLSFLIELEALHGRSRLDGEEIFVALRY